MLCIYYKFFISQLLKNLLKVPLITFAKHGNISNKLLLWALDDINFNKQFLSNTFVYILKLKLHFSYLILYLGLYFL